MSRRAPRALPGKRSIQNPSTDAMFWTLLGIVIAGTHSMGGCAAVPATAGQGDRLLNRKADVRAAQHEGQVIKRGRNHGGLECGHDGGPCLARASASTRCLNLVSTLACEPNDVSETQGDGSTGGVCAATAAGQVRAHTVKRRANRRLFMTSACA